MAALALCGILALYCIGPAAAQAMQDYIVRFNADRLTVSAKVQDDTEQVTFQSAPTAAAVARDYHAQVIFNFSRVYPGSVLRLTPKAAEALRYDPRVTAVEPDAPVSVTDGVHTKPLWNLDRIDQRGPAPATNTFWFPNAGQVSIYIIDTGIRVTHSEFGGRAKIGFDAFGETGADGHGHGTHVAATAAGATYGIARDANIWGVRVLDNQGSGTIGTVMAGVDWVTANHQKPAVANMSLGGGVSDALDEAVRRSVQAGIVYVVAAGNNGGDATNKSPARVREAITVGATDDKDFRASFSNYGPGVDLFAPGVNIKSAWNSSNSSTATLQGTSMAAPHVTGVVAAYLHNNPKALPAQVEQFLIGQATMNVVLDAGPGSPNRLLYLKPVREVAYNTFNRHYYERVDAAGTWKDARDRAKARTLQGIPGYLASFTHKSETDFVWGVFGNIHGYWAGAFQDAGSKPKLGWNWVSGESFSPYSGFWYPGEPSGGEYRLCFWGGPRFNDIAGTTRLPGFVVEYDN